MPNAIDNLGVITFLMLKNPDMATVTLGQMRNIVLPALQHKLAVTATVPGKNPDGVPSPVAFALFAKVNDAWDAKLRDPNFDLADLPEDAWTSGGNKWLVEFASVNKASGAFVEKAALAIFPKGGTLHIRARGAAGQAEIGKRRFGPAH